MASVVITREVLVPKFKSLPFSHWAVGRGGPNSSKLSNSVTNSVTSDRNHWLNETMLRKYKSPNDQMTATAKEKNGNHKQP